MMLFTSSRSGHLFITLKPHHSRHLQFETIKTKKCTTHRALISSFVTCCRKAFQTRGLSGCSRRQDQVHNPSPALTMVTLCTHYLLRLWTNLGTDDWSTRLSSSSHWPGPPEKRLFWKERKKIMLRTTGWCEKKKQTQREPVWRLIYNLVDEAHQVAVGPTSLVKFVIKSRISSDGSNKI